MAPARSSQKRQAPNGINNNPQKRVQITSDARSKKKIAQKSVKNVVPTERLAVYVFGEGSAGELGLGSRNATDVTVPRLNSKLNDVVSVATGGMHAAALTSDNRVLTWGVNDQAALGRDTTWDGGLRDADAGSDSESEADLNPLEATPTAIPDGALPAAFKVVQIAAGDSTTFVLGQDGSVYGWGTFRDGNGVYGFTLDPTTGERIKIQKQPYRIPELRNIVSLSVGTDFALALDASGSVFAWGPGQEHQLGRRVIERHRSRALLPSRVAIPKSRKVVSIHAGSDHAFAIDSEGVTWAWGLNNFAQTGIPDSAGTDGASIIAPRKVTALADKNMKMISGGRHHSLGVTEDRQCLVWGRLDGDQLGLDVSKLPLNDDTKVLLDERQKPRALLQPTPLPIGNCTYVAAGTDHSIAITSEGRAYSWGFNINYQCGQGTSDDIAIAKLMNAKSIRETKLTWAGCGGQFSMLAAVAGAEARLPNGVP